MKKESIFDLHKLILDDYRSFVRSFFTVADPRAREFIERSFEQGDSFWPDYLLQVSPSYERVATVDELAAQGTILPETAQLFRDGRGQPYYLFRHQVESIERAHSGKSFVVTTGTGSGKTLAFLIPIVDSVLRHPMENYRVAAFVVYPMNALVNSQVLALETLKTDFEKRTGKEFPIRFARYTGETRAEEREALRERPPHILLTNYVMMELMLVRPEDQRFVDRAGGGLRFLVFDELHTYRGRRGADVAMLIRRLKERCAGEHLIHIGTSATMVANRSASAQERRKAVADFASRIFGHLMKADNVIEETIIPYTEPKAPSPSALVAAMDMPAPNSAAAFRAYPLARWLEAQLGYEVEESDRLRRRIPRSLESVAQSLSEVTGVSLPECEDKLREVLDRGGELEREDGGRVFAFKLHQFIGQGRALFATFEPPDVRSFSLEGQIKGEEGKLFAPIRFCRQCGQDYYHVLRTEDGFEPHPISYFNGDDAKDAGYLMLASADNDWSEDQIPEEWRDGRGRLNKRTWGSRVPEPVWIDRDGKFLPEGHPDAMKAWWQPEPFALCLRCGEFYSRREREFTKLATLSSEGRSTSTSVLAASLLKRARETQAARDKLLTFTDNRQDASLQAGHFNDFTHVAVLRCALYHALRERGELRFDEVARSVFETSGLTLRDIAKNPELNETSQAAQDVRKSFLEVTEFRLYEDLRRGWRVIQPNLEHVGLLKIGYRGLSELSEDDSQWGFHSTFTNVDANKRKFICQAFLDRFRRKLAISAGCLTEEAQYRMRSRAHQHLNSFWGLDPDVSELRTAKRFIRGIGSGRTIKGFSLGAQSALGRFLTRELDVPMDVYEDVLDSLMDILLQHGLLTRLEQVNGHTPYQLDAGAIIWQLGDGTPPPPDPIYVHRASSGYVSTDPNLNAYYQQFYRGDPKTLASFEAREHTAQVVKSGARERRERRFRWEKSDINKESELGRRLPYLVCSPTMELGVDIADLDLVHLRNVPPTPANYAQRGGRAGRQGQPGIVFTYCGAINSHDQYYFKRREEMVAGSVRPPRLDIANEALVRSHVHAAWLSHVRLPLGRSVEEVLDIDVEAMLLQENAQRQIQLSAAAKHEIKQQVVSMLSSDMPLLASAGWFSSDWVERIIDEAPTRFNRAFGRWRDLYLAASRQLQQSNRALERARNKQDEERARARQAEALHQRRLLLQRNTEREESDFYPYRYLASEGFLPGYSFPSLPVRAWVPRDAGEYIARPRFLAIRELAPGNMFYHEGTKWEVTSFQSPPGGLKERKRKHRLCLSCGAYSSPDHDLCPNCGTRFNGQNSLVVDLLDMPNVRMRRRDRITSDEEERRRRGYRIETFFQYSEESDNARVVKAEVASGDKPLLSLTYAPAASLLKVNHGWNYTTQPGFLVDFENGDVKLKDDLELNSSGPPTAHDWQNIRLSVQETQNALLMRIQDADRRKDRRFEATLVYALARGIEMTYELEESELEVLRLGEGEHRSILFYEASEGGAGVLRRLVEEADGMARIASAALGRCHFDQEGNDLKKSCHAACYDCLMSYRNQFDALLLDRHVVSDFLVDMTHCSTQQQSGSRSWDEQLAWLRTLTDERSDLEMEFLNVLAEGRHRLPDDAQRKIDKPRCVADFYYAPNICVFCDGSVHDQPEQREQDARLREELVQRGYRVISLRYDTGLAEQINQFPEIFGSAVSL